MAAASFAVMVEEATTVSESCAIAEAVTRSDVTALAPKLGACYLACYHDAPNEALRAGAASRVPITDSRLVVAAECRRSALRRD